MSYDPFITGLCGKVASKLTPNDIHFLAGNIQCFAIEKYIAKHIIWSSEQSSTYQVILQKIAHNALSLCGAWPDAGKGENLIGLYVK